MGECDIHPTMQSVNKTRCPLRAAACAHLAARRARHVACVALPAAADPDKIALELTDDGRLLVRVEKPPAPPEPTQIPIVKRVVAEEKRVEAPPKNAAELETELDSKFAVAPSPEATATAEAEVEVEKAEAEAAA